MHKEEPYIPTYLDGYNKAKEEFESRRCEDCKLFGHACHLYMRVYQLGWEDNFSCSKWEAKN